MRSLLFLALVGCGDPGQLGRSVVAPSDVATHVKLEDVPVNGAEVTVVRNDETKVTGELLEATDDEVMVLKEARLVRVSADDIRSVVVTRYENGPLIATLAAWSAIGAGAQSSHGIFAGVTEPIWGIISTASMLPVAADEGRFAYADKKSDFVFLREYARFPQGLPAQFRKAR